MVVEPEAAGTTRSPVDVFEFVGSVGTPHPHTVRTVR